MEGWLRGREFMKLSEFFGQDDNFSRDEKPHGIMHWEGERMTYKRLFYLKFKKGLSTYELVRRFPDEIERVSQIALLDIPDATLREILDKKETYRRMKRLKKRFLRFF